MAVSIAEAQCTMVYVAYNSFPAICVHKIV